MSLNNRVKKLLIIACLGGLMIFSLYSVINHLDFSNKAQLLLKKPLPILKGGPEYSHRKPFNNPQYKDVVFYTGSNTIKEAALTFDDGPDNIFTPKILDILKQNNIKATFFIIGNRAKVYPEIVKRIVAEGHAIGNHSWDHPDLDKLSPDNVKYEIQKQMIYYFL